MIPTLSIPDIRDYQRINADLVALLGLGHSEVRLLGAERQRLLASGLRGNWIARVVIEGNCGPEVAADLDAPNLTIECLGDVGDGAGRGLKAGRLVVNGSAGDATGFLMTGGTLLVVGGSGDRTGLRQRGGEIVVFGPTGRLTSDRRSGGILRLRLDSTGPHLARGASGGSLMPIEPKR